MISSSTKEILTRVAREIARGKHPVRMLDLHWCLAGYVLRDGGYRWDGEAEIWKDGTGRRVPCMTAAERELGLTVDEGSALLDLTCWPIPLQRRYWSVNDDRAAGKVVIERIEQFLSATAPTPVSAPTAAATVVAPPQDDGRWTEHRRRRGRGK